MRWARSSIAGLLTLTVGCALALAALRSGSRLWLSLFYTFTVVILLVAAIAARVKRRPARTFWFGFAVFGWGFFLLGMVPWPVPGVLLAEEERPPLNEGLVTTQLIQRVIPLLRTRTNDLDQIAGYTFNTTHVAHLVASLVIAPFGGIIAVSMERRRASGGPASPRRGPPDVLVISTLVFAGMTATSLAAAWLGSTRSQRPYFPRPADTEDTIMRGTHWFSSQLEAMREPSLWRRFRAGNSARAYRLLLLPSFSHGVSVRIEQTRTGANLRAVALDGLGGYFPGQIAIDRHVVLTADQWAELEKRVNNADFWSQPTDSEEGEVMDGTEHIIEGLRPLEYRVVKRVLTADKYDELWRYMLALSGIKASTDDLE
jgi:hypothetical protein